MSWEYHTVLKFENIFSCTFLILNIIVNSLCCSQEVLPQTQGKPEEHGSGHTGSDQGSNHKWISKEG